LTCANPARHVRDRLASVPAASSAAEGLDGLLEALMSWDTLRLADRPGRLAGIRKQADDMHPVAASSTALQVDMALALAGRSVHSAVAAEVALAGELLLRMSPYPDGPPHLHAYREAFEARYGADRAVPLIELLDPQFGLGPPASHRPVERRFEPPPDPRRELALQALALRAQRERLRVVQLDDELLEQLETWSPDAGTAPVSLDISAFVAAPSAAALDAGDFQVILGPNLGAEGAGRNTGRFAELLGADATAALIRTANAEAERAPRSLGVELVYAPARARSANVSIRPAVRQHEIVLGAMPGVAWEQVVPPEELIVTVSQGRLRVCWPHADAELAVRQGHMLNPLLAPPIARFLLEVGSDRRVRLSPFSWGSAGAFPFLPRVQRGRVVLSLAQWRVSAGSYPDGLAPEPAGSFAEALSVWRARWSVPSHVYLASGDNRLLLNLDDAACAGLLREELRRLPADELLLLEEALPGPDHAWLPGPTGHHLLELVVPLVLRATVERKALDHASAGAWQSVMPSVSRLRPPGSDWLYLKLYAPATLHEQLLAGPVRALAQLARSAALTDGWFFIRYADPDPHLRIRFHGVPSVLLGTLLDQLCTMAKTLVSDGACQRFSFETYEREIERFGGEHGMTIAEAIFASDSVAVAELVSASRGLPELDRLTLAVLSIDDLLAALGLTEAERRIWYRDGASIASEDGREYRRRRAELRRLLSDPNARSALPAGATVGEILAARRHALRSAANALDSAQANGFLHTDKATLCAGYVHLHCNRLLPVGSPIGVQALQLLRRAREGLARYPHTGPNVA
jgi:lantibiotic biosynthesis protein